MIDKKANASYLQLRQQDYQQVQEILAGNKQPWEHLYNSAYRTVIQCAKKADTIHLLSSGDYQDAVAQAFYLCLEQLSQYQGISRFAYWVGGYARNIIRNRCKRERTKIRNQSLLKQSAVLHIYKGNPLQILIYLEKCQCLQQAFTMLPPLEQKIVCSMILDNVTPRTIAREIKLSRKETMFRYQTAIVFLRKQFIHYYHHLYDNK